MKNVIKFDTQKLAKSIKVGSFNIGVNDTPTDPAGFYNGISPLIGGYVIYINKSQNGPSIHCPKNDQELIDTVKAMKGNAPTAEDALVWINSQSNMVVLNSNYPPIVTNGLVLNVDSSSVASYPRKGTSWRDIGSSGSNSVLYNGISYTNENYGIFTLDGVDDYIDTGKTASALGIYDSDYTFDAWVYPTDLTSDRTLFGTDQSGLRMGLHLVFRGGSIYHGHYGADYNAGSADLNQWNHITYTYKKSTRKATIYKNGILMGTSNIDSFIGTGNILIGRWAGTYYFKGNVCNYKIYNRELTQQEVLQNYYAGSKRFIPTTGLVYYLDPQNTNLYAGSSTTAYDLSPNYINGTLVNGPIYISPGEGSWKFDGVDDYITIPNNSNLQITGDQTLVFWVYPERRNIRQNFYNKAYGGEGTITYETNGALNYFYGTSGVDGGSYQGFGTSSAIMANLNQWYFVVLVRDLSSASKTLKWYINGVLNNTTTATYSAAKAGVLPITLGKGYAGSFLGRLGLSLQYNVALNQSQITTIYNATRYRYGL
jgi:hypothetical protein